MGRKPLLAIAGALLAGVTLSGCEAGPQYYSGQRSYLPSQGYRGGYTQGGMMYSQPQMIAGAASANTSMAMTMKPAVAETTPAIQLASGSAPASTTPMLTITMPAVRFQVPLTGAITYAQTTGTSATGPASVEQLPTSATASESPLMQAATAHAPVPAQYAPASVPFTTPTVQSTNYAAPAQPTMPAHTAPASQAFAVPGQSAMGAAPPMPSPAQYLPPVSPAPRADAGQFSSELPPPPVWPRTPAEAAEETTMPPVPPPIHRGPALGTTPAAPARPTLYYQ